MKTLAVFLSGLTATITGAFIRSCGDSGLPAEFAQSWCGGSPLQFVAATHQHCAGCMLVVVGIGLIAASPVLTRCSALRAERSAKR